MATNNEESQNILNDDEYCVKIVALNEDQEETMGNFMEQSTQHVLEIDAPKPKKKQAKGKTLLSSQKKTILNNHLIKWLENFWQADSTLRVMKPFLKSVNDAALKTKNMKLFNVGQTLQRIMKEFFIYMKTQNKDLTNCGYNTFEEWSLNEGLSMTFGKLQTMDWVEGLESTLFDHYSTALTELEERQANIETEDAEEENTTLPESSSSRNTKNIYTSSMTVRTPDRHADVHTSKDCATTSQTLAPQKKSKSGLKAKSVTFQKEKSPSLKRRIIRDMEDSDQEDTYQKGSLFRKTVEEESEPEIDLEIPKTKRRKQRMSTDSEEDNHTPNEEDFTSMVASHARAHSLVTSTGKICQTILIKDDDGYINISSPGERGSMIIKLELYPFKDCVKLSKNQYWTKRTFSCLGVSSGEDSRVQKLAMKLKYELTKQVMNLKDVKVEKKVQTGWKGF
ncbi:unnamed protein product [Diatraea saccharalis]|uniref:Uncharacterized protein n=1 Tax=Diatraea saccharalis TaxID=40085 RepID=A0A9N9WHJ0_9NEOP|nr:unnamed protein product [Diatraea saccharalis]